MALPMCKYAHPSRDPFQSAGSTDQLLTTHPEQKSWSGSTRARDRMKHLVVHLGTESRDWGYRKIHGTLPNLRHEVARGTIANLLQEHVLEPVATSPGWLGWSFR